MIVSHKHKFIFLKTRKTAGTSLEIFLSKFCSDDCIITHLYPHEEEIRLNHGGRIAQNCMKPWTQYGINDWLKLWKRRTLRRSIRVYSQHMHASNAKPLIGEEIWNSYFKFCFERNPWSKTVSDYHWKLIKEGTPDVSFEEYLERKNHRHIDWNTYTINNRIEVDYIGRYEHLSEDLRYVCERIGIPYEDRLPSAKKFKATKRDYKNYYSDAQIEHVARMFHKEINAFGYRFEDSGSSLPFIA